jgi:hypothetical protein
MRHTGNRIGGSNPSLSASRIDRLMSFAVGKSVLGIWRKPAAP